VAGGFGERLRDALEASGLTHVQVADLIGSRPELISRWLKLEEAPRSKYVALLADALDIRHPWLLSGHGQMAARRSDGDPTREEFDALAGRLDVVERWIRETDRQRDDAVDRLREIADEVNRET